MDAQYEGKCSKPDCRRSSRKACPVLLLLYILSFLYFPHSLVWKTFFSHFDLIWFDRLFKAGSSSHCSSLPSVSWVMDRVCKNRKCTESRSLDSKLWIATVMQSWAALEWRARWSHRPVPSKFTSPSVHRDEEPSGGVFGPQAVVNEAADGSSHLRGRHTGKCPATPVTFESYWD